MRKAVWGQLCLSAQVHLNCVILRDAARIREVAVAAARQSDTAGYGNQGVPSCCYLQQAKARLPLLLAPILTVPGLAT